MNLRSKNKMIKIININTIIKDKKDKNLVDHYLDIQDNVECDYANDDDDLIQQNIVLFLTSQDISKFNHKQLSFILADLNKLIGARPLGSKYFDWIKNWNLMLN